MSSEHGNNIPKEAKAAGSEGIRITPWLVAALGLIVSLTSGCENKKDNLTRAARPQEPPEPLPYRSEEVCFENPKAGIKLRGTLTLPSTPGPHPGVVLVSGSGPQDRDETVAGHKPFLVLADHLTRRGIAVLRYDDRGVGASSGEFETATVPDFASDARAAVEFLASRTQIDASKIGLAGHSEGGIVAPMVALDMPGQVSFLVLLAAPAHPGEEIFYLQDAAEARVKGVDEAAIERSRKRKEQIFAVLKEEADIAEAADKLRQVMRAMPLTAEEQSDIAASGANIDDMIEQQIRTLNTPATRLFLAYDPIPALSRVDVPVLAITGERDLQVPPDDNLPLIETALATGPCPSHVVHKLPGLNHLFQTSETGLPEDYAQIDETFAPTALELIADWILDQVHPAQ